MNSSIRIALLAAVAVAGMTACTSTPASQHNSAPQTSSTPTSTSSSETSSPPPPVVTEVVTQTVTNPPKPDAAVQTDNRIGYGGIKIGMTLDEVRAAGLTDLTWDSDGDPFCVADRKLTISKKFGVVRIVLPAEAKTSKGVGVGSTFADVRKAYPNASEYRDGWSARLNDEVVGYAFVGEPGNDANKVELVKLTSSKADCSLALL
ncbi:MAG TPA: hypothetical protein VF821_06225 [Lentzea sp.]